MQLVREIERIRCQLTTVEKANRDLKTDAMRNFAMVQHMKYLNEIEPIGKSKGCKYTTEEVELKNTFAEH